MQTNLDFIKTGATFPPSSEALRIKHYEDNLKLYKGLVDQVFSWYLTRLRTDLGEEAATTFCTALNYFKLVSVKTADLVCGEKPDISFGEDTDDAIKEIINECAEIVNKKLRTAVIDFSRFGETVLRTYAGANQEPKLVVVRPIMLVPVVNNEDNEDIKYYVIAYSETVKELQADVTYVNVQIHERGRYTTRRFRATKSERKVQTENTETISYYSYTLGEQIGADVVETTGLDDFAIFHIANEPTSDNIHGTSDYDMFSSLVAELEVRFAQIARILDKHADPAVAAPTECFELATDQSGKVLGIKMGGKAFPLSDPNAKLPQYITWDGQLTAAFLQIEKIMAQIDKLTEMGAVLADNSDQTGTQGYEAMQVRMTTAKLKARRISEAFDKPYKQMIAALYQIKTRKPLTADFTVTWNDGLPNDALRDAQIARTEADGKLKSKKTIRQEFYGMSPEQADAEEQQIQKEQPAQNIETVFE